MQLIINNPYRVIGILAGTSLRDQTKSFNRLKQYIEAEEEPPEDFCFPLLGPTKRTIERVNEAASKLNLDSDKMNAALFWFYKGNAIADEPAFDFMKDKDEDQAIEIWERLTSAGEVNTRNCSAFQNLSTLMLCKAFDGVTVNTAFFEKGVSSKLKFLESDHFNEFKKAVTDITFSTTKKQLQFFFLNQIQSEIDRHQGISSSKFLTILMKQDFSAKDDFLQGLVDKPIKQIVARIEQTKDKRVADNANAFAAGKTLYENTNQELFQLKSVLGASNIKFSAISDKVSTEILQCGIDYFNYHRDTIFDPGEQALDLFRKAFALAIGNAAKQRHQENLPILQEWINEKPERERQKRVVNDLERLTALIDDYAKRTETVANAKLLLSSAKLYLSNVKAVLGATDDFYLTISSRVASDAQGMCVSEVNKLNDNTSRPGDFLTKLAAQLLLKQRVDEAWEVSNIIGGMDLTQQFRASYANNKNSLSSLKSQLVNVTPYSSVSRPVTKKPASSNSSGCYIATMAYGDYDHPKVVILRDFRDRLLIKSSAGRCFVKIYYLLSPKLVTILKDKRAINSLIRQSLNQFTKFLNK